jgi:glycerol-3-phosphate dehydrogenase (NAD(P)+)
MKVCVVGSGNWGSAIFNLLKKNRVEAHLISRLNFDTLKKETFNTLFIALRTEAIQDFITNYIQFIPKKICSLSKGVFTTEAPFLSSYLLERGFNFATLFGPNFADEVECENYTISTISSNNLTFAKDLQAILQNKFFETEISNDIKSAEIYGIFKNIIAIFTGFASGMQMCENTKSAIFTKLIHEMIDFAKKCGGQESSFFLSSGIGDLFLTASSSKSRNFDFGMNFAKESSFKPEKTVEGLRSLASLPAFEKIYNYKFVTYRKLYNLIIKGEKFEI